MACFLLLTTLIAPNGGRLPGKAAVPTIAHVRRGLTGSFFVFGHGSAGDRMMRTDGFAGTTTSSELGRASWMATLGFMLCFAALTLASMVAARAEPLVPEKDELKFGFIK
ncbi:MAG: hypothetical protein WC684_11830, partial [Hyphomicrobium sp.]